MCEYINDQELKIELYQKLLFEASKDNTKELKCGCENEFKCKHKKRS